MVNYKREVRDYIDLGGWTHIIKATEKLVYLIAPLNLGAAYTLHDGKTGGNYVVPTGKKTKIVYIIAYDGAGTASYIFDGDTVDSENDANTLFAPASVLNIGGFILESNFTAAGRFINVRDASNWNIPPRLYALEVDV